MTLPYELCTSIAAPGSASLPGRTMTAAQFEQVRSSLEHQMTLVGGTLDSHKLFEDQAHGEFTCSLGVWNRVSVLQIYRSVFRGNTWRGSICAWLKETRGDLFFEMSSDGKWTENTVPVVRTKGQEARS